MKVFGDPIVGVVKKCHVCEDRVVSELSSQRVTELNNLLVYRDAILKESAKAAANWNQVEQTFLQDKELSKQEIMGLGSG